ncbi:MAG: hypothetical protein WC505_00760 [Patescibacteria group bacterium]
MYVTTHVLASIVISQHTPNAWWAFSIALLSHYVLDFIPHGDRPVERWIKRGSHLKRSLVVVGIDGALLSFMILSLDRQIGLPPAPILMAAIIGGMLPDILWITYDLYCRYIKKRAFARALAGAGILGAFFKKIGFFLDHHTKIHHYVDHVINTHRFPALIGALFQLLFFGIFTVLAVYVW